MGLPHSANEQPSLDLANVVTELRAARDAWRDGQDRHAEFGALGFPSRQAMTRIIDVLAAALFPLRLGPSDLRVENEDAFVLASLESALPLLAAQIRMELHYSRPDRGSEAIEHAVAPARNGRPCAKCSSRP